MGPNSSDAVAAAPQTTLSIGTTDSVDPVITAVNFNLSATVGNIGANEATNITCTITLDASLTYVSSSGTGWTLGQVGQVVTATRASIAAVDSAPAIIVTVTSGGSALTATTTVTAIADNAPQVNDSETTTVKLVDRDATSGERWPADATQWTDFNAYHVAIGTANYPNVSPSSQHLFQDASGNPSDSIGTFTMTVENAAGISYQNAVTGRSRKAINLTSGTAGLIRSTDAGLPNINAASMLSIFVAKVTTSAATRDVCLIGATATRAMMKTIITTGVAQGLFVGNSANGAADAGGAVRPWVIRVNRTASTNTAFTDVDKLAPAFAGTMAGQSIAIGNLVSGCSTTQYLGAIHFFNAAAEMSDAGLKALLTALGYTVTWS